MRQGRSGLSQLVMHKPEAATDPRVAGDSGPQLYRGFMTKNELRRYRITIEPHEQEQSETIMLEAVDIRAALAIADINLAKGSVEIFDCDRKLARATKRAGPHPVYWELN